MSVLERCPSYRESKKRSKKRQGPTLKCPFYRGVRLIEVSVKRESTVLHTLLRQTPMKLALCVHLSEMSFSQIVNKKSIERKGPTLDVHFSKVSTS